MDEPKIKEPKIEVSQIEEQQMEISEIQEPKMDVSKIKETKMDSSQFLEELSMDYKVSKCRYHQTDVEFALQEQLGSREVFFMGMDKTGKGVCEKFIKGTCHLGNLCPLRHVTGDKQVVCKHWLRGLCKKGDQCEFLHEYNLSKMPECFFYSKYGVCSNKECPFRHIDPESKIRDCPWYDRGICRHGPNCKQRHIRRVLCPNYLCGLCLEGKDCKFAHPSFDLPTPEVNPLDPRSNLQCYNCHERSHKVSNCPYLPINVPARSQSELNRARNYNAWNTEKDRRNVDVVTCFKCGTVGHYANRCTKGALAFLSNSSNVQTPMESTLQCYNCYGQGHDTPDCPHLQDDRISVINQSFDRQLHRSLDKVTCFKCGEIGHYANRCTKPKSVRSNLWQ